MSTYECTLARVTTDGYIPSTAALSKNNTKSDCSADSKCLTIWDLTYLYRKSASHRLDSSHQTHRTDALSLRPLPMRREATVAEMEVGLKISIKSVS